MKVIKITNNAKRPELRLLKKPSFWFFTLSAIFVAVTEIIFDNPICALWALLAATMHAFVLIFQMYADDFVDINCELVKELDTMVDVLKEQEAEIIELQEEINKLKS